jgi:hypothetical protein
VNAQGGQHGMTAAQLAVLGGHDEALKVLLAAGVDVNAKNGVSMVKSAMIVTRDEGVGEVGGRKGGGGRRRGGPLALLLLLLVAGAHVCVFVCVSVCVFVRAVYNLLSKAVFE